MAVSQQEDFLILSSDIWPQDFCFPQKLKYHTCHVSLSGTVVCQTHGYEIG